MYLATVEGLGMPYSYLHSVTHSSLTTWIQRHCKCVVLWSYIYTQEMNNKTKTMMEDILNV